MAGKIAFTVVSFDLRDEMRLPSAASTLAHKVLAEEPASERNRFLGLKFFRFNQAPHAPLLATMSDPSRSNAQATAARHKADLLRSLRISILEGIVAMPIVTMSLPVNVFMTALVAKALCAGFGCRVLASDPVIDADLVKLGVDYVPRETLLREAEIISLHCPLTPETRHLIDEQVLRTAKAGLVIVNTSRGALIDTRALIEALKQRRVAGVALDVYEQEAGIFFDDLSSEIIEDDMLQRLLTFPNVLMTGHQAFLTEEALTAIARTTLGNIADFAAGRPLANQLLYESIYN